MTPEEQQQIAQRFDNLIVRYQNLDAQGARQTHGDRMNVIDQMLQLVSRHITEGNYDLAAANLDMPDNFIGSIETDVLESIQEVGPGQKIYPKGRVPGPFSVNTGMIALGVAALALGFFAGRKR